MAKIIAVTSGKGGAGKSTCSVMLSLAFLKQGKKVLLIDLDEGMRCLDMLLGLSEKLLFDLSDAVAGRNLETCILTHPKHENLSLLAAPAEKGLIEPAAFKTFLEGIDPSLFDIVICDLPAGSDRVLYAAFPTSSEFICVANPNSVSVRDAAVIGKLLRDINRNGKVLLNKFEKRFVANPVFKDIDEIIDNAGLMLIGIVPQSEKLSFAFLNGKYPSKGRAFKAFDRIAKRLCDKAVALPKLKKI